MVVKEFLQNVYFIIHYYFIEAEITFYQESTPNHNTVLAIKYTYILIGNFIFSVHTKTIIPHIKNLLFIYFMSVLPAFMSIYRVCACY